MNKNHKKLKRLAFCFIKLFVMNDDDFVQYESKLSQYPLNESAKKLISELDTAESAMFVVVKTMAAMLLTNRKLN